MTRRTWALVAAVAVLVVAVNVAFSGSGAVDGPRSSSYVTGPQGTAALAALLKRSGHRVRRLRAPLERRAPPAGATTLVLDPVRLSGPESAALVRVLRAGGRVVAAGRGVERLAADLRAGAPTAAPDGPRALALAAPAPETAGIRGVRTAGERSWVDAGGGLPLLAADDRVGALAIDAPRGGRLLLLADPSPLQNRLLATGENAAFALALTGRPDAPVAFAESIHGYAEATGLAAIPDRWWFAVVGGLLALGLLGWARGRRFGPPEARERTLDPPRREYVEALAATLLRTPDRGSAAAPVREAARARLARRAGLAADADPAVWRAAAERAGLPDDEVAALTGERPELLATGRAHARLAHEET